MPAASAHRLDEYLQATRVAIDVDRIGIEIDLTAGAHIASRIFALIDTDRDGRLSDAEQERYAREVVDAARLTVDGNPSSLAVVSRQFPTLDEMTTGTGTIRLRAEARTSSGAGHHELAYFNAHAPDASVYLVNALVPSDGRLEFGSPKRDPHQRGLMLGFDVAADALWRRAGWTTIAIAGLLFFRSRRASERRTLAAVPVPYLRRAQRS